MENSAELEYMRYNLPMLKNTITEMKNTLERNGSKLDDTDERMSNLEAKIAEINQSEHTKKLKMRRV